MALILLLGAIATLVGQGRPPAVVTVSGLTLAATREQVFAVLGQPSFQQDQSRPTHVEYWSQSPSLSIDFHPDGSTLRLQGGRPEINGEDVRHWSLEKVERYLGPPSGASQGTSLSNGGSPIEGDAFLKYPERRLLVVWNPESGTDFILFADSD
jgi:hypothetical protein